MTSSSSEKKHHLNKISEAAASAHKDGYQVAVLAVRQDDRGSNFTFKYEGVEGKPCKLLEQLFKEIVSVYGGTNFHSHSFETNTACEEQKHTCITRNDSDDKTQLQLLLDVANLINSARSKTAKKQPCSDSSNVSDYDEFGDCEPKAGEGRSRSENIAMDQELELSDHTHPEVDEHTSCNTYSLTSNTPMDVPGCMDVPGYEDINQGEMTETEDSIQADTESSFDPNANETKEILPQTSAVKLEPTDVELSLFDLECTSTEILPGLQGHEKFKRPFPGQIKSSNKSGGSCSLASEEKVATNQGERSRSVLGHLTLLPSTTKTSGSDRNSELHLTNLVEPTNITVCLQNPIDSVSDILTLNPTNTISPNRAAIVGPSTKRKKKKAVPRKCPYCPYISLHKTSRHISEVHNKMKPFTCPFCKYTSSRKYDFRLHVVNSHRRGELSKITAQIKSCDESGKFMCPLCPYGSENMSHVHRHIAIHHIVI